jgi:hypothetical protein
MRESNQDGDTDAEDAEDARHTVRTLKNAAAGNRPESH